MIQDILKGYEETLSRMGDDQLKHEKEQLERADKYNGGARIMLNMVVREIRIRQQGAN